MTRNQLELLSDMIADKVFERIQEYLEENYKDYPAASEPIGPEQYFHKNVDAFGNVRFDPPPQPTQKQLLEAQMRELEHKWTQLLKEEKYELLQELKEIYEKIKSDYNKL